MADSLLSVGLDVGTTSTQMVLSRLWVENRASGFAVPQLQITGREILYKSPIHFTPLKGEDLVDGVGLKRLVSREYELAGIRPEQVDTGAVIVTGETGRRENAREVLHALSEFAGEFVVAAAGPDLESTLAARGAGAVEYSRKEGKTVLHMDIGGGTTNLALIRCGEIRATGCVNVGGRLICTDGAGRLTRVSPVLRGLWQGKPGSTVTREQCRDLAQLLNEVLEMAAGLRPGDQRLRELTTAGTAPLPLAAWEEGTVLSFSGGVADCIREQIPWDRYSDLGPLLGSAIREGRLCAGLCLLGSQTIRATVIGAGCHSTRLSGSTVFHQNVEFPLKNLPVVRPEPDTPEVLAGLAGQHRRCILALEGPPSPTYRDVQRLTSQLKAALPGGEVLVCVQQDMAKALGQSLAAELGPEARILCIDRVMPGPDSYLDIGAPVGPALPVVVKTLAVGL